MSRPAVECKVALTFEEQITAAYLYYVRGVDQHVIAIALGGVNPGRVNTACKLVADALTRSAKHEVVVSMSGHSTIADFEDVIAQQSGGMP